LSPHCDFYFPKSKKTYIKLKYNIDQDWKVLVETLLEVYGSNIGNYSIIGKRGNRPPINRQLYNGLFGKYIKFKKKFIHIYIITKQNVFDSE